MYMVVRTSVFARIVEQLKLFRDRGHSMNAGFQFANFDYTVRMAVGPGLLDKPGDITVRVGPEQDSRIYAGLGATELDVAVRTMKLKPGEEVAVLFTRKSPAEEGIPIRVAPLSSQRFPQTSSRVEDGLDFNWLDFPHMPGRVFVGSPAWGRPVSWF